MSRNFSVDFQVNIIIPDVKAIPDSIASLLLDTDHYVVKNLPLQELIRKPFIDGFVKQGTSARTIFQHGTLPPTFLLRRSILLYVGEYSN